MDFEKKKQIFIKVLSYLPELNELLSYTNCSVDKRMVAIHLDNSICVLETKDMNIYLASLLFLVFNLKNDIIKVSKENIEQIIISNFVNTILEELDIKQIEIEVV